MKLLTKNRHRTSLPYYVGAFFFIFISFFLLKNAWSSNHLGATVGRESLEPNAGITIDKDPPVQGHLIARIRVLTQNVYGFDEENCKERAKTFGNSVAIINTTSPYGPYDIIAVQEFYKKYWADWWIACDHNALLEAIQSEGQYLNSDNSFLFRPRVRFQHNGGIGIFTLHKIIQGGEWRWSNDTQVKPKSAEGFVFARIKIPNTDLTIDTYSVHFNSGADIREVRKKELVQLANKIQELSQNSGNPVLVMGDFNIGGPRPLVNPPGNAGYEDIMEILHNPRDLWLEDNWNADSKFGYTSGCWVYSGDPNSCDGEKRIDYIFIPTHADLTNNSYQILIAHPTDIQTGVPIHGVSRVRFHKTVIAYPPIRYASDHFGVEAFLEIRNKPVSLRGLDNKCLTAQNGKAESGTPIILFPCDNRNRNKWSINEGEIRGIGGYCLDVPGGSTEIGTPLQLYTCNDSKSQRFDLTENGEIRSRLDPNLCVEIRGGFTENGTPIQTYNCNGTLSQKWMLSN